MNKFDRYDTNGVYNIRLSTGTKQTLVVTSTTESYLRGYVAETFKGNFEDRQKTVVRVDARRVTFRHSAVIGKSFVGGFKRFDCYEFPKGGPTTLLLEVPEDARDDVDFEYKPVSCPGDEPEVNVEPGSCNWSGDFRETLAGDKCPSCGTKIDDPEA